MHQWQGGSLPEEESEAYQEGKAKAVDALLPYTARSSVEAATIVVRKDGRTPPVTVGTRDNVSIAFPGNLAVAHLHSHSEEAAHSEGDWAGFAALPNIEQAHVVTPTKTYSLHKPPGWKASEHGFKEILPIDTEDEQEAKTSHNEDQFLNVLGEVMRAQGLAGRKDWKEASYEAANAEMAHKTGIIFRIGKR